jgi:hypothetical protein
MCGVGSVRVVGADNGDERVWFRDGVLAVAARSVRVVDVPNGAWVIVLSLVGPTVPRPAFVPGLYSVLSTGSPPP